VPITLFCAILMCSSSAPPAPIYSSREAAELSFHFATSRIAEQVAHKKLNHESLAAVAAEYDRKNAESQTRDLIGALVKKVYEDDVTDSSAYALEFFKESATRLTDIPPERVGPAAACMQNGMAAEMLHAYRIGGLGKDKVAELLARNHREVPQAIIDRVYAAPIEREDIGLTVFSDCLMPLTRP